jgi:hypothetical protein
MQPRRFRYARVVETFVVCSALALVLGFAARAAHKSSAGNIASGDATDASRSSIVASQVTTMATVPTAGAPIPDDAIPFPCGDTCELVVRASADAATVSQSGAQDILARAGIAFAYGGEHSGFPVTVQAAYGIATFGHRASNGQWIDGPLNLPLGDGTTLDHLENRLVWVLNYHVAPTELPGTQGMMTQHVVYIIDEMTGGILYTFGYTGE